MCCLSSNSFSTKMPSHHPLCHYTSMIHSILTAHDILLVLDIGEGRRILLPEILAPNASAVANLEVKTHSSRFLASSSAFLIS
uniref:Putative ovule protein n=1 Tax=Solanum chacoense TaxID=4108 RepID=A0A0V0GTJ8_SOLCH